MRKKQKIHLRIIPVIFLVETPVVLVVPEAILPVPAAQGEVPVVVPEALRSAVAFQDRYLAWIVLYPEASGYRMKRAGGTKERTEAIRRTAGAMKPITESPIGIIS